MGGDGETAFIRHQLPLAESVLRVFRHAFDEGVLRALYETHRGSCYEGVLTFPNLVNLVLDALTIHGGSGHAAFTQAQRAGRLPVAETNVYAKLGRVPLAVSQALLREGSRRLVPIQSVGSAAMPGWPPALSAFAPVVIDGKKIKNAAKRLAVLRGRPGKMLAAKVLAGVSLPTGLVVAFAADPDGERNDVPLVDGLLPQVRAGVSGPILWIADRQFADLSLPEKFLGQQDHFLLRLTKKMSFSADPTRAERTGVDAEGRGYRERWGWIGRAADPRRRYVRAIELTEPTDAGDALCLITDVLDADRYPAADWLEAYRQRWSIEQVFQQVTEVFGLQQLIGSRPEAAVFQAALCFVLYNAIQVVRSHVAAANVVPVAEVSSELVFRDVRKELVCWDYLMGRSASWPGLAESWTAERLRDWLATTLSGRWHTGWKKAKAKKKPPKGWQPPKTPKGHGGHSSVHRILHGEE